MTFDRFGRKLHYLRISLTDHCNMRCLYCLPPDTTFRPNAELMQNDEILQLTRLFASLGFDKIRLTGGEPTLRGNLVELVRDIAGTPGIRAVSMTTNGMLLAKLARPLAKAGLQRVNISIDTLDPDKFRRLTCVGKLQDVWQGIMAAGQAGLQPIKLNVVVVRGYNEEDVVDLARLTLQHAWQVRFIEMMPFGGAIEFQTRKMVTAAETQQRIRQALGPLSSIDDGKLNGEARLFQLPGAQGTLGFIYSITEPFCEDCNRARLTADGKLRLCLLREQEVDLLTLLRNGVPLDDLKKVVLEALWNKPWGQNLADGALPLQRALNEIGG